MYPNWVPRWVLTPASENGCLDTYWSTSGIETSTILHHLGGGASSTLVRSNFLEVSALHSCLAVTGCEGKAKGPGLLDLIRVDPKCFSLLPTTENMAFIQRKYRGRVRACVSSTGSASSQAKLEIDVRVPRCSFPRTCQNASLLFVKLYAAATTMHLIDKDCLIRQFYVTSILGSVCFNRGPSRLGTMNRFYQTAVGRWPFGIKRVILTGASGQRTSSDYPLSELFVC